MPWLRRRYDTRIAPASRGAGAGAATGGRGSGSARSSGPAACQPVAIFTTSSWSMAPATERTMVDGRYADRQWPTTPSWVARRTAPIVPAISRPNGWRPYIELVEQGEHVVGGRVHVHADLVDDDWLLGRHVATAQKRVERQLADRLESDLDADGRHLGAEDGELSIGARVDRAANALDDLRQRTGRRVAARPLEHEVLEEVRQAGMTVVLVARPDRDEERDAGGSGPGHVLGHHAEPAREGPSADEPGDGADRGRARAGVAVTRRPRPRRGRCRRHRSRPTSAAPSG